MAIARTITMLALAREALERFGNNTDHAIAYLSQRLRDDSELREALGPVDKPNPDPNGCKDDKGREALNEFIVAGCDAS